MRMPKTKQFKEKVYFRIRNEQQEGVAQHILEVGRYCNIVWQPPMASMRHQSGLLTYLSLRAEGFQLSCSPVIKLLDCWTETKEIRDLLNDIFTKHCNIILNR